MKNMKWTALLQFVRKRAVIVGLAALLGVTLNAVIFFELLLPSMQQRHSANEQLSQLEQSVADMKKRPSPGSPNALVIVNLIKQVPTQPDLTGLLLGLNEVGNKTSVEYKSIRFGEQPTAEKDVLSSYMEANSGKTAAGAASANGAGTGTTNNNVSTSSSSAQKAQDRAAGEFEEIKFTISAEGTYAGLMSFLAEVQQTEREVHLRSWQMQPLSDQAAAADQPSRIAMTLNLSAFSAVKYAGKLGGDVPVTEKPTIPRTDPTMSTDQFLKQYESTKP